MSTIAINNATIINEGKHFSGSVLLKNGLIESIGLNKAFTNNTKTIIDAQGKFLIPGVIDDQVHFREPGLTHKGDIYSESKAAVAGGVTSFMDMPNTNPQTITIEELDKKHDIASIRSLANFSFYLGATNSNIQEIIKADPRKICGIKVFMGSSTGNMLVDDAESLDMIFRTSPVLVATHCEDEETIKQNTIYYNKVYNKDIPFSYHPLIRSSEACYLSSNLAVKLAKQYKTKLHLLHLSTEKEMDLLSNNTPLSDKLITGEVCVHHLWFSDKDYNNLGWRIKWNPAIKTPSDRDALIEGLISNKLDVVATDHAPHTIKEKENPYLTCPSGGPLVQHSLIAMLEMVRKGIFTIEMVVEKMCHSPAELFKIDKRGYIREGYHADLVLIDPNAIRKVTKENILYKCGWSPFENETFSHRVTHTFVNGRLVYDNGRFDESVKGSALCFSR
jgi:dihydroorotase